jgi:integrase
LSRKEQDKLLAHWDEEYPRRRLALEMGLHGLRTHEIEKITYNDFRQLDVDDGGWVLQVADDTKTGKRETPCTSELKQRAKFLKSAAKLRQDEKLIGVANRTMRSWMNDIRTELAEETDNSTWLRLGLHDLRRTWATDTYYALSLAGVPIAETLTLSWGGWKMSETGRQTFRENYLGPVPDHVVADARTTLPFG